MSSPGNLSALWGADSPAIDKQLQITVNCPHYGRMSFEQPWINTGPNPTGTANGQSHQWPSQTLDPSSRFSNKSDYMSDAGRSFGADSVGWMNEMTPDDNSFISELSTTTKDWDELHLESTQGLRVETLHFHSPSHMHENIRRDEPTMRSFTFGRGFSNHPNTSTAKYQAPAPADPVASTSSLVNKLQPIHPSALVNNEQPSAHFEIEQFDAVNTASSSNNHSNATTRRTRIRSTTRAGVPRWTALDLRRAQEMRRQGNTMAEIATALNRTENSVTGKLWRARGNDPHKSDKKHQDGEPAN